MRGVQAGLVAALLILLPACSTGSIGALYVLDGAVVVEEAAPSFQRVIIARGERPRELRGRLVAATPDGRWAVIQEGVPRLRNVRTSPMGAHDRKPLWVDDRRLRVCIAADGAVRDLPNPFDNDDTHIVELRVVRDELVVAVEERYNVQPPLLPRRYHARTLPHAPWRELRGEEGRRLLPRAWLPRIFADLRAGAPSWGPIETYEELVARDLNHGAWGAVFVRSRHGRNAVVYRAPDGREHVLLRQTDLGPQDDAAIEMMGRKLNLPPPERRGG